MTTDEGGRRTEDRERRTGICDLRVSIVDFACFGICLRNPGVAAKKNLIIHLIIQNRFYMCPHDSESVNLDAAGRRAGGPAYKHKEYH